VNLAVQLDAVSLLGERERRREPPVGSDVRLQVGDLLLRGADGVGARDEAARRRLLARNRDERPRMPMRMSKAFV
jgi:hypothetical protein